MSDVIAAIASGRQPAAIGILRLSGEGCAAVAGKVFVPLGGMELAAVSIIAPARTPDTADFNFVANFILIPPKILYAR